jgi:hypothetical protein
LLFHASLLSLFACVAATGFAGALAYGVVYTRGKWIEAGKSS